MLPRLAPSSLLAGLLTVTLLALSACGPGSFAPKTFPAATKGTGAENKSGLPYTTASASADLEILKQAIDPGVKVNLDFASTITNVTLSRFDLAGNAVSVAPAKLEIRIQYKAKLVTYSPVLTASHEAASVTSKDDAGATTLKVHCLDADCAATEIRITSGSSQAGLIHRSRHVSIDALGPFASAQASMTRLDRIGSLAASAKDAILLTTEVAWGPAMFDLTAGDVEASGDLVATGGDEENVTVKVKSEAPVEGRLLGNSNKGDLLLRLSDGSAWSFLRVRIILTPDEIPSQPDTNPASPSGTDTTPVVPDDTPASEKLIPFDPANPVTAAFEKDKINPVVQNEIKLIAAGIRKDDMQKFLNRLQPNLSLVLKDLKTQNIPPELLFIMFIESPYFYSNYNISVSSAKAVGPWQFMLDTARGLGLTAHDLSVVPTRIVNKKQFYKYAARTCDERTDLDLSTLAAAKYLRTLLDTFRNDPKLAVMAYNMGATGLSRRLNCIGQKQKGATSCNGSAKPLEALDLAGLDYWTIRDLNAAPKESIDYVPRFLAAQFVGREPSRYGFKVNGAGIPPAPSLPAACR